MVTDYTRKIKELAKKKYIKGEDVEKIYILEALNLLSQKKQVLNSEELENIISKLNNKEMQFATVGYSFYKTLPQMNNYTCVFYKDLEMQFAINFQNLQYFYYFFEMKNKFYNSFDNSGKIPATASYINFEKILSSFFDRIKTLNYSNLMKDIISPEVHTIEEDLTVINSYNAMLEVFESIYNINFNPAKINLSMLRRKFSICNDSLDFILKNISDSKIKNEVQKIFSFTGWENFGAISEIKKMELKNKILNIPVEKRSEEFSFMFDFMDFLQGIENGC